MRWAGVGVYGGGGVGGIRIKGRTAEMLSSPFCLRIATTESVSSDTNGFCFLHYWRFCPCTPTLPFSNQLFFQRRYRFGVEFRFRLNLFPRCQECLHLLISWLFCPTDFFFAGTPGAVGSPLRAVHAQTAKVVRLAWRASPRPPLAPTRVGYTEIEKCRFPVRGSPNLGIALRVVPKSADSRYPSR